MPNEVRKKLLADYAVALVAERESWGRLHEPDLTEAERCRILGEWKQVSAGLKKLVRQLRDLPVAAVPLAPPSSPSMDAAARLSGELAEEWDATEDATAAPGPSEATALRRPLHVFCLVASSRLIAMLRARLETTVPRLGSL